MVEKIVQPPYGYTAPYFQWDENQVSTKIQILEDQLTCKVKEGSGFKTVLGSIVFAPGGKYYFEVVLIKGYLFKIGVSRPKINLEQAFSDGPEGWAFYNGELRHNSNSTGAKYGTTLTTGDVIGVGLDMVEGTLSFYKNGESWGIGFTDEELKIGEFVPACAPIYTSDQFQLKMLIRED